MDKSNYDWYWKQAEKWKEINFSLKVKRDEYWLAHLICEAEKLSEYGIGGAAFRHWVSGLFKNGVYLYVDNYDIGIKCTSDSKTTLIPQCQESCAYGDPWPKPINGEWINYELLSSDIQIYVMNIVQELCEEVYNVVIDKANKIEQQVNKERELNRIKQQEINNKWQEVLFK